MLAKALIARGGLLGYQAVLEVSWTLPASVVHEPKSMPPQILVILVFPLKRVSPPVDRLPPRHTDGIKPTSTAKRHRRHKLTQQTPYAEA